MSNMQFFSLEEHDKGTQSLIYNWEACRYINNGLEVKVVINPYELSFLEYIKNKNDNNQNKRERILSISFTRTDDSELKTKVILEDLIKNETKRGYFEELFKDFIWDLKVNEGFQEDNINHKLSSLFEQYNFIYGISCKLKFDVFCTNPETSDSEDDKTLQSLKTRYWPLSGGRDDDTNSHFATESFEDWLYYLCNAQHEVFFTDERYYKGKNHWFLTLDEELDGVLKLLDEFKDQVREPEILANISSNFLMQRYAVDKVIKYYSFKKSNNSIPGMSNISLILSILCIFLTYHFFWLGSNEWSRPFFFLGSAFFLLPATFFVFNALSHLLRRKQINTQYSKNTIWKNAVSFKIFLPRLFVGILSGWLVFITTEEIFKMDISITNRMTLTIFIIIILILGMYMYYEIRNIAISAKRDLIFKRVFKILGLGFSISFIIGVVLSLFYFNKMLENESVIKGFYKLELKADKLDTLSSIDEVISISEEGLEIMDKLFSTNEVLENMEKFWEQVIDNQTRQISRYEVSKKPIILKTVKQYRQINKNLYRQLTSVLHVLKLSTESRTAEDAISVLERSANDDNGGTVNLRYFYNSNVDLFKHNNSIFIGLLKNHEKLVQERNDYAKNIKDEFSYTNLYKAFLSDSKYVLRISDSHYLIPNSLLFRSCMAMFIGIFLQLIIQDRTLTESV